MTNRITAISVAGFKALPHDNPPVVHLPGITVLTGANSSGKSSLILALRILKESLLEEPDGARLYLRARGLPQHREMSVHKVFHFGETDKPIRYRLCGVVDDQPVMVELAYRWGGETGHPGNTTLPYSPLTLRVASKTVFVGEAGSGGGMGRGPWSDGWVADSSGETEAAIMQLLAGWSTSSAALDSVRGRSLTPTEDPWGGDKRSDLVWPCGSNTELLLGRQEAIDGGWDTDADRWYPRPAGEETMQYEDYGCGALCEFLGLDAFASAGAGPGYPATISKRVFPHESDPENPYPQDAQYHGLTDFGDGQQQVYPAMLQMALSNPGTCLLWEHPDLHLHPAASTQLGRLIHMCAQAGRSIVVETHSRDLVDGIRLQAWASKVQLAQDAAAGEMATSSTPRAMLLGFWRDGASRVHSVHDLTSQAAEMPWPEGFVDREQAVHDEFRESLADKIRPGDPSYVASFLEEHEEGQHVEYKAAYRWNLEEQRNDDRVLERALRAICGMLNSRDGGCVIFGVDDARKIVGIAYDTAGVADKDKFQQMVVEGVVRRLDGTAYERCCRMSFIQHGGETVAWLDCRPSETPVWMDGRQFFSRKGNTTREVQGQALTDYVRSRWPATS